VVGVVGNDTINSSCRYGMTLVAARNPQGTFTIAGIDKAEVSSNDSAEELCC
jgi:hypothetical protein